MSKTNPSKKRAGLVYANMYGIGGKCTGKAWMTPTEAANRFAMNQTYLRYLEYKREAEVVTATPRWLRLWRFIKSKITWL